MGAFIGCLGLSLRATQLKETNASNLNREDLLSWPAKRIVSCAFVRSRR
jgi:hypothetical protein